MESPTLHISPASFESFVEAIASSGLIAADELSSSVSAANHNWCELSKQLCDKGLLTTFQLTNLSEGHTSALRIGNYDILDRLGAGGMGTVFKARHRRMKRIVALKVLAANLSGNELFVKRFQREVETIAALGHPNVVMAYDADESDVGHFLVMEFVNGHDLAGCVDHDGPFPLSAAVDCTLQAAQGLAYAHSQGIIHRDIKPHNLLRDQNGVVKVTDLGLARLNHGADGPAAGADVTMAGGAIGTVDYMPPEQAVDATTTDHRADIYSLGCTLYYLLAGKPPFSGTTLMAILLKHRDGEIPSLASVCPKAPPELDDLYRRMMAKSPEQRVQHMSDVVAELSTIAAKLSPASRVAASKLDTSSTSFSFGASTNTTLSKMSPSEMTLATETGAAPVTVLVVEPSRVQASIIKGYLQEHSLSVIGTAANGKDAIKEVHSLRPRAVASAMYLSDMSGVELAQQIRSEIKVDAPGFVLITSEAEEGESASLSKLNRVLSLAKPFTANQLVEALNLVTGASTSWRASESRTQVEFQTTLKRDRAQLRVLIVDDSSPARIHVRNALQSHGFQQFLEVPDGAYAIAVAAQESCDLIVTDYNMPLMDGRALVSYLKQNPATAAIPILMVTTETDSKVLDPVRRLGVVAIVEKAFPADVVGPILDSLFG